MATETSAVPPQLSSHNQLYRQVGLIGLLWASEGSIIGSGWLFGAQGALATAGPAALLSWGIAAVIVIVLAFGVVYLRLVRPGIIKSANE